MQDVVAEIAETGTYVHTAEELTVGARLAWRHNTRCIGKLYWRGLTVRDLRDVTDAEGIAEGCLDHGEFVFNKGRIKPTITIFAPTRPASPPRRCGNSQLISYAGHRQAGRDDRRRPDTVAITELAKSHGWAPAKEGPVRHPADDRRDRRRRDQRPRRAARAGARGRDRAPDASRGLAELGLRWWGFPSISDNVLSIGGINYPCAPFTGWYLAPEISARDFTDTYRYNLLPEIAEALGIDTSDVRSLWKDRAVIELTTAVLHSYDKAGIRMDDHHTAAQKFHKWTQSRRTRAAPSRPSGRG